MTSSAATTSRRLLRLPALFVLSLSLGASALAQAPRVLTDQELLDWARDTYQREDWIYAALHMNALLQRNPAALRANPTLVKELGDGLAYAVGQLQSWQKAAQASVPTAGVVGTPAGGVGSVHSGLKAAPPVIHFPK